MLYYMQGFDIHQYIPEHVSLNPGGKDDASPEWFGGTPSWPGYIEGYGDESRAMSLNHWPTEAFYPYPGLIPTARKFAIGSWVRMTQVNNPLMFTNIYFVGFQDVNGVWRSISLRTSSGDVTLVIDDQIIESRSGLGFAWEYIELSWDMNEGFARVKIGDDEFIYNDVVFPDTPSTARANVHVSGNRTSNTSGSVSTAVYLAYDHMWFADEPLPANGIGGVSVVASVDRYESTNDFRGAIVLGGEHFQTKYSANSGWTSLQPFGEQGQNTAGTISLLFPNNPKTGEPWTPATFAGVSAWGLCYEVWLHPNKSRVMAMLFSWLDLNNGKPLVKYTAPGKIAMFSGPWEKTDPLKTFGAHVDVIPRPAVPMRDDATYLTISDEGCLLFDLTPDTPPPTSIVGLSFAEERRTDYNEWYDIIGGALPVKAHFITGYNVLSEGNKSFQSNYVTVNYVPVPFGSAYIQGLWDYAQSGDTGRWSSRQQIYSNSDTRYSNRMRKLKIRGQGNALQMKVTAEDNLPFSINGWTIAASSNGAV